MRMRMKMRIERILSILKLPVKSDEHHCRNQTTDKVHTTGVLSHYHPHQRQHQPEYTSARPQNNIV